MLLAILMLAFAAIGTKLLVALAVIYWLVPSDPRCVLCNGETLRVTAHRGLRRFGRLVRLQRRWCPRCGCTALARGGRELRVTVESTQKATGRLLRSRSAGRS